jgi:alpha-1,2-mannosyltransferase
MIDRESAPKIETEWASSDHAPHWVERWGPRVLLVGFVLQLVTMAIWIRAFRDQVDLSIYRFGGQQLLHGAPLYDYGLLGNPHQLLFNYPPFAAVLFSPIALFPMLLLRLLVPISNLALLFFVIRHCWRWLGVRDGGELRSLTMLGVGSLLWLEPVRTTIWLGQISLVLLVVVVVDLLPLSGPRRWEGMGVGLAAGIKLTPLFFIPFLLITRRIRAAAVAMTTFLGTVALGFLITPAQALKYWFHGIFDDLGRIAPVGSTRNESLRGMLARMSLSGSASRLAWIITALILTTLCLAVAALAHRRGQEVLAIALCGLGSAAVSPFSWGYHWVWFVPLAVYLADRAIVRGKRVAGALLALLWVATVAWITGWRDPSTGKTPPTGVTSLHPGGWLEELTRNIYLVVFLAALMLATALLRRSDVIEP